MTTANSSQPAETPTFPAAQMFTVTEAANALEMDTSRIRRAVYDGRLPAQRLGPIWMITGAALTKFEATRRRRGGGAAVA